MDVTDLIHRGQEVLCHVHIAIENGVGGVVIDENTGRIHQLHDLLQDSACAVLTVGLQHQRHVIFLQIGHQITDVLGHYGVGGHCLILQMGLADGGNNVVAAEEVGQSNVADKIADAIGVHQVGMTAHGKGDQTGLIQHVLDLQQPRKALVGKYMLRPALGGGQFDIAETCLLDTGNGLLNRKAVVAVGVYRDDALFSHGVPLPFR